jgi:hypothetical protein
VRRGRGRSEEEKFDKRYHRKIISLFNLSTIYHIMIWKQNTIRNCFQSRAEQQNASRSKRWSKDTLQSRRANSPVFGHNALFSVSRTAFGTTMITYTVRSHFMRWVRFWIRRIIQNSHKSGQVLKHMSFLPNFFGIHTISNLIMFLLYYFKFAEMRPHCALRRTRAPRNIFGAPCPVWSQDLRRCAVNNRLIRPTNYDLFIQWYDCSK